MIKSIKIFLLLFIPIFIQSCSWNIGSSKFSCPMPETLNLKCMPPSKIYLLSEKKQLYKMRKVSKKDKKKNKKCSVCTKSQNYKKYAGVCDNLTNYKYNKFPNKIELEQDNVDFLPVLQKPKILLVWFSYWIDNDGDLHSNEYVYLKVKKRFWSVGNRLFGQDKLLFTPLVEPEKFNISIEQHQNSQSDVFDVEKFEN